MKFRQKAYAYMKVAMSYGFIKSSEIFARHLLAKKNYEFKINGNNINLRKNSSDFEVFFTVFPKKNYYIKALKNLQPKVIVDLGANIGLSAAYFKMSFPDALVIAVEPDIDNLELAAQNTKGFADVKLCRNAIWFENDTIEFKDSGEGEYALSVVSEGKVKSVVEAITMNDLISRFNLTTIDILKIDIEGAELELFSKGSLDWLKLVRCIIIELHDWNRPGCSETFFRALYPYHYTLERHGESVAIFMDHQAKEQVIPAPAI